MNYWEKAALNREAENCKEAEAAIREMLELYDAALEDIRGEIDKIVYNYGKRLVFDEETENCICPAQCRRAEMMSL